TIASAVQEQGSAINEISRSLSNATVASQEISSNIEKVAAAAKDTTTGAAETAMTAETLAKVALGLRLVVEQFTLPKTA
ncbi:MAG: methyl-accepting chemotaxis protein, partial [Verrucomicrobiota bacterium]